MDSHCGLLAPPFPPANSSTQTRTRKALVARITAGFTVLL
jgi:hypothetical protein